MEYALCFFVIGTMLTYEKCGVFYGCTVAFGAASPVDTISVERVGSQITYKRVNHVDGSVWTYNSAVPTSGTLFAGLLFDNGSVTGVTLTDAQFVSGGTYYLGAIADPAGKIPELTTTNNVAINQSVGGATPNPVVFAVQLGATQTGQGNKSGGGGMIVLLLPLLFGRFLLFGSPRRFKFS